MPKSARDRAPRNAALIRQWNILRTLDVSRLGRTVEELAAEAGVHTRTIYRDIEALNASGFLVDPFDEGADGKRRYKLNATPLKALTDTGFTLSEACALYFSGSMLEKLAGTPFRDDLREAFRKIETVLPLKVRRFLDRLPAVLVTKPGARERGTPKRERDHVTRLLDAIFESRLVRMRYHSFAHDEVRNYVVEPCQVVYGQGRLYLIAWVREYQQIRTFAIERIKQLSVLEETFEPVDRNLAKEAFPDSLGVFTGPRERIVLQFEPSIARYVRERQWHPSQRLSDRSDGGVELTLEVCNDVALRTWILGFGSLVRVASPASLAEDILSELDEARSRYTPRMEFAMPPARYDPDLQRLLPFRETSH